MDPTAPRYPDDAHVEATCKAGQIGCCRYLAMGAGGWSCEKHSEMRAHLDARVAAGTIRATGDNCDGLDSR